MSDHAQLLARLMAGLETPDDLTEQEQAEHRDDLLTFLQGEYEGAESVLPRVSIMLRDPYGNEVENHPSLSAFEAAGLAQSFVRAQMSEDGLGGSVEWTTRECDCEFDIRGKDPECPLHGGAQCPK